MKCRECPCLGRHKDGALICTFFMPAYETNLDQDCFVAEVGGDHTFQKTIYDEILEQESKVRKGGVNGNYIRRNKQDK